MYLGDDAVALRTSTAVVAGTSVRGGRRRADRRAPARPVRAVRRAVGGGRGHGDRVAATLAGHRQEELVPLAHCWLALHGRADECHDHVAAAREIAARRPMGLIQDSALWALGVLDLGLGDSRPPPSPTCARSPTRWWSGSQGPRLPGGVRTSVPVRPARPARPRGRLPRCAASTRSSDENGMSESHEDGLHVVVGRAAARDPPSSESCTPPAGASARSTAVAAPPGVEAVAADATDAAQMRQACAGAAVVYNCVNPPFARARGSCSRPRWTARSTARRPRAPSWCSRTTPGCTER